MDISLIIAKIDAEYSAGVGVEDGSLLTHCLRLSGFHRRQVTIYTTILKTINIQCRIVRAVDVRFNRKSCCNCRAFDPAHKNVRVLMVA